MTPLFGRRLRLVVADKGGAGIDLGRLSTRFVVTRDLAAGYAKAKLTIYNLSPDTTAKLGGEFTRIQLEAGYEDRQGLIFDGEVRYVIPTKEGADRIVDVYARSGLRSLETTKVEATHPAGTQVVTVIQSIAAAMGLEVGEINLDAQAIVGPMTIATIAQRALDNLSRDYSFQWMVDNGKLVIGKVPATPGGPSILISRETGMIGSPLVSNKGTVEFTTLLDPRIRPLGHVEIQSATPRLIAADDSFSFGTARFRSLKGTQWQILRMIHIGETRGQPWYTRGFALPVGGIA